MYSHWESLYEKLKNYGASDFYGFHMPGHKRRMGQFENPFQWDITEIDGFDDLHHPEKDGVLAGAQERAASLYGAEESHFLVNGSTAGILSAISGCVSRGGKLLLARNSHRSAYHGAELRNLWVSYLYPQTIEAWGINGGILPEDVEKVLAEEEGIEAVFVTSPTYDGICSDVRSIADICHRAGMPLIVDQAHGAHFPFSDYFPEDAVRAGADVVIHSVHKTLPALTQTALLHLQGKLADRERIRHYLSVYQTSSPSYVLMASIDTCMELLEQKGQELFAEYAKRLECFRTCCQDLRYLPLAGKELGGTCAVQDFDRSKLLISTRKAGISGSQLSRLLRERYHLEMEMSAPQYVTGISSVADTEEGFARLQQALHELDAEAGKRQEQEARTGGKAQKITGSRTGNKKGFAPAQAKVRPGTALETEQEAIILKNCENRISGVYVYLYPPGIPLLAPGEMILEDNIRQIETWQAEGLEVHGLEADGTLRVLKESEAEQRRSEEKE